MNIRPYAGQAYKYAKQGSVIIRKNASELTIFILVFLFFSLVISSVSRAEDSQMSTPRDEEKKEIILNT